MIHLERQKMIHPPNKVTHFIKLDFQKKYTISEKYQFQRKIKLKDKKNE